MSFKTWVMPLLRELFVPGTYNTRPQDITNVDLMSRNAGLRSKYVARGDGPTEPEPTNTADFGMDVPAEKEESKEMRKLKRLKAFRKSQRSYYDEP